MAPYAAPLQRMSSTLRHAARLPDVLAVAQSDLDATVVDAVLAEAGRFATGILDPLNHSGDLEGARITAEGDVTTPRGFREAYGAFVAAGWPALCAPGEAGGQGYPHVIGIACAEIWAAGNLSFALCPELAVGAALALSRHASAELRERYLAPIVSGTWTTTMCLTEPQAGSDLGAVAMRAMPEGEHYRLSGHKQFISWGEHDLTANIVHLVLARLPDAPPGTRGLSLFLVPREIEIDGTSVRNDLHALSIEHKLGLRASPTCVLAFGERGGAQGWLVGAEHGGIACMFTMMNLMRLGVAAQSVGVAERACQAARAYAFERKQGSDRAGKSMAIIGHPDVRRMLWQMRALTDAARAMVYYAAAQSDLVHLAVEPTARERAQRRLDLMTPILKAWCSEAAIEVTSLAIQVHGGVGYVEETGVAQYFRDVRVASIYEGTNAVQAGDLLRRKLLGDAGAALRECLDEMRAEAAAALHEASMERASIAIALVEAVDLVDATVRALLSRVQEEGVEGAHAVATSCLDLIGTTIGAWMCLRLAQAAEMRAVARFYVAHILPRTRTEAAIVTGGGAIVMNARVEDL